jgi:hypothetical protein
MKVYHSHGQKLTDNTKTTKTISVERMQEEKTKRLATIMVWLHKRRFGLQSY